jgi:hypothetical protein
MDTRPTQRCSKFGSGTQNSAPEIKGSWAEPCDLLRDQGSSVSSPCSMVSGQLTTRLTDTSRSCTWMRQGSPTRSTTPSDLGQVVAFTISGTSRCSRLANPNSVNRSGMRVSRGRNRSARIPTSRHRPDVAARLRLCIAMHAGRVDARALGSSGVAGGSATLLGTPRADAR